MSKESVFTIGIGGRRPSEVLAICEALRIRTVADIRRRPDRARRRAFAMTENPDRGIEGLLASISVTWVHLPELVDLFGDFLDRDWRRTELLNACGRLLTDRLLSLPGPVVLLCDEPDADDCHRSQIGCFLEQQGYAIRHIGTDESENLAASQRRPAA